MSDSDGAKLVNRALKALTKKMAEKQIRCIPEHSQKPLLVRFRGKQFMVSRPLESFEFLKQELFIDVTVKCTFNTIQFYIQFHIQCLNLLLYYLLLFGKFTPIGYSTESQIYTYRATDLGLAQKDF